MNAESPCINVCKMDQASGLCSGCFRTLDEIASWSRLNEQEISRVLSALPARQKSLTEDAAANAFDRSVDNLQTIRKNAFGKNTQEFNV